MNNEKLVAEKLLQIKAIKLSPSEPFTWASGWQSPIYCDNRKSLSYPEIRDLITAELVEYVNREYGEVEVIAGVATAGIAWGALVADRLKLPFCYVRPKPKEHGLGNQIEGFLQQNSRVVVIEDLVSTGKSSLQAIEALVNNTAKILGLLSIFNYGFEEAQENFAKKKIPFKSITDYATLISLAVDKQLINPEDQKALLNWRSKPSAWNKSS
ncbi:orotate phosphoribosyltransferase [soil metagenome]